MPTITSAWSRIATAASSTKMTSQVLPIMDSHAARKIPLRLSRLAFLFLVSLLAGIKRRRQLLFLLCHDVLPAFDEILGLAPQVAALARDVIPALARLLRQVLPGLLARPGRKEQREDGANAEPRYKESEVRSAVIITHGNLRNRVSIQQCPT